MIAKEIKTKKATPIIAATAIKIPVILGTLSII